MPHALEGVRLHERLQREGVDVMEIYLDTRKIEDYQTFLKVKSLPRYRFSGNSAWFPDEYAHMLGIKTSRRERSKYAAPSWMFDYQGAITELAVRKKKFCVFLEPGLGKTGILLDFALHAMRSMPKKRVTLIVSPLMVVRQTIAEAKKFYGGEYPVKQIASRDLQSFLDSGAGIGITNYEALTEDITPGRLGALIGDETSIMKSHYGAWGQKMIDIGRGLEWKLALTGTPAPNDRIEYANHAVFMDAFPNVNSFLARFFINRGKTNERWELRPHAIEPFYRALSDWCIFCTNPATYGWKDNSDNIPPIHSHVHHIDLTDEQHAAVTKEGGTLYFVAAGGITSRQKYAQIAKGNHNGEKIETRKPAFICDLVGSWKESESTIIWCRYNPEQDRLADMMPDAASIDGSTPYEKRDELIDAFKDGQIKTIISKPKVMGFGLNLQIATRQVFSSCQDSYEEYYQAVKRSNRVGSKRPLNVHMPVTELEVPMMENVLRKAAMVQRDTEEQERIFKQYGFI